MKERDGRTHPGGQFSFQLLTKSIVPHGEETILVRQDPGWFVPKALGEIRSNAR